MAEFNTANSQQVNVPFFLRAAAILIIVSGAIGLLFFLFTTGFQFTGGNSYYHVDYKGYGGSAFYLILFLEIIFNLGFVLSGFYLLKLRKTGMVLFAVTFAVMAFMNYLLQDESGWTIPIIGALLIMIIILHKKRLS